jgi:hypothetical protein
MAWKSYAEKLKDPRWQRKRLEVMQRELFTCEECESTDKTLNVHLGYYEKGRDPWEYDSETLHCLCVDCHDVAENARVAALREIASLSILDCEMVMDIVSTLKKTHESERNGIVGEMLWLMVNCIEGAANAH